VSASRQELPRSWLKRLGVNCANVTNSRIVMTDDRSESCLCRQPFAEAVTRYSETVCTTLLTGRVLATGSFASLIMASS
jgi:hypothetical protein